MKQPLLKSAISSKSINCDERIAYEDRISLFSNPVAQRLLATIVEKKSNIAVSADVITKSALLALADSVGPYICMLKTHIDIIMDFDWDCIEQLQKLAKKHNFIIFEDRKFADIGNTVWHQYHNGIFHISRWADVVNAHLTSGPAIVDGLKESSAVKDRALLLLAQMSSQDNLISPEYTEQNIEIAQQHSDFVIGFICREKLAGHNFLYLAPGVNLQQKKADALGQSYLTPQRLIADGIDILIVGRGIYQAKDPVLAAQEYQEAGWHAYEQSLKKAQ